MQERLSEVYDCTIRQVAWATREDRHPTSMLVGKTDAALSAFRYALSLHTSIGAIIGQIYYSGNALQQVP